MYYIRWDYGNNCSFHLYHDHSPVKVYSHKRVDFISVLCEEDWFGVIDGLHAADGMVILVNDVVNTACQLRNLNFKHYIIAELVLTFKL